MFVKDVVVQNQVGLHARPATFFIQKADGPDEEAAVKGLVDLVDSGFAEGAR